MSLVLNNRAQMSPCIHPHPNLDVVIGLIILCSSTDHSFIFVPTFVRISAKVWQLQRRQVSKLKIIKDIIPLKI